VLRVGNLEAERDFLDVRDVARAYALTVQRTVMTSNRASF
jgi:GDP-4-dehydro-6-deoxy-D-mannose reductase